MIRSYLLLHIYYKNILYERPKSNETLLVSEYMYMYLASSIVNVFSVFISYGPVQCVHLLWTRSVCSFLMDLFSVFISYGPVQCVHLLWTCSVC